MSDLHTLASDQRELLFSLPYSGHQLVTGPPGSGKSLLAAHRAALLALGGPVLLLTRSNPLRQSIAPVVAPLDPAQGVQVSTVHSWLGEWYQARTGRRPPAGEGGWYEWAAFYPLAAVEPEEQPALVVDEGQDLSPDFYRLCRILAMPVTVFADECQRITDTQSTLADIARTLGSCQTFELMVNHRNTHQIAALANSFHVGTTLPPLPKRQGPTPALHRWETMRHLVDHLAATVEQQPERTVCVLLRRKRQQFDLLAEVSRRAPKLPVQLYTSNTKAPRYRTMDTSRPGLCIVNRASAKGLGFDTVIVPDTHEDAAQDPTAAGLRMTYYVMATRARQELQLGYSGAEEPPLLAAVPHDLLVRAPAAQPPMKGLGSPL